MNAFETKNQNKSFEGSSLRYLSQHVLSCPITRHHSHSHAICSQKQWKTVTSRGAGFLIWSWTSQVLYLLLVCGLSILPVYNNCLWHCDHLLFLLPARLYYLFTFVWDMYYLIVRSQYLLTTYHAVGKWQVVYLKPTYFLLVTDTDSGN